MSTNFYHVNIVNMVITVVFFPFVSFHNTSENLQPCAVSDLIGQGGADVLVIRLVLMCHIPGVLKV